MYSTTSRAEGRGRYFEVLLVPVLYSTGGAQLLLTAAAVVCGIAARQILGRQCGVVLSAACVLACCTGVHHMDIILL